MMSSCTYPDNGDYSLSFDGDGDYVYGPENNFPNGSQDRTLSIKLKANSFDLTNAIFKYSQENSNKMFGIGFVPSDLVSGSFGVIIMIYLQ